MAITREPNFPIEFAQLMKAMSAVCEGQPVDAVEQASANMFASAIHNGARMRGVTDEDFPRHARVWVEEVFKSAIENWNRKPKPTDVPVRGN